MSELDGLMKTDSTPIPLTGVRVEGDILGRGAKVRVIQRFKNNEQEAVEAVYKFPVPEGAAICGLRVHVGGRVIQGRLEEREKAFEIYDKALEQGDGAYLLDEERPNILTLSVGNVNPGSEVVTEIEYVMLLDSDGGRNRFFLPTTISPRYIPDGMEEENGIPEDERVNPPYAIEVPYGLSIAIAVHQGAQIESIESPTHPVRIDLSKDPVRVSFSADLVRMDRDFILYIEQKSASLSRAYTCLEDGESFLQLDFTLPEEPSDRDDKGDKEQRETIFLLDCSGSMEGDSIREAKKALEICLRALSEGTFLNICRFGSNYQTLFDRSKPCSKEVLQVTLNYLGKIDADLGGTEILKPLRHILKSQKREADLILLTDGEVGNEKEVLSLVKKGRGSARVFPLAIGAGPNEYFIRAIARAGNGIPGFIYPGERIEPKALKTFGMLSGEALQDVSISWGRSEVEQAPFSPAIFGESPATFFARRVGKEPWPDKIMVKGKINGKKRSWDVEVKETSDSNLPIPLLWARERIRDLEEFMANPEERGSRQFGRKSERWRKEVINISCNYGLLSES
ncbi:MAG: VIT and VWA domain-containing protein, partial [Proteobacteria bacterium]|nr:VIT and VWA domain-containing protein [Pseudomonadota bacterium]